MKSLFISVVFFFSTSVFAKADIATLADQLGKISASGVVVYELDGSTPEELVMSLSEKTKAYAEEVFLDYKDVEGSGEARWGTTDAKTFLNIVFAGIHFMDDNANADQALYSDEDRQEVRAFLAELKNTDVIYSWNPGSEHVCGESLTSPVLIDPQTKKAYEINFYDIEPGC
ncbi:hypothetical protein K2X05_04475 [bacterium]|nr:hypothetical protein [bacterium]